jgi:hypothetical protein
MCVVGNIWKDGGYYELWWSYWVKW